MSEPGSTAGSDVPELTDARDRALIAYGRKLGREEVVGAVEDLLARVPDFPPGDLAITHGGFSHARAMQCDKCPGYPHVGCVKSGELRATLNRVTPPDTCHNEHPFVPGVSTDHEPGESDPSWCNTCGEARVTPEEDR